MDSYSKREPLVTIITVCYNSKTTISRAMESVLYQTYPFVEYIVVDGGSKDGTLTIIQEFERQFGKRLRIISEPDCGIYDAMNKGIKMATGSLIGILNSDDYYEKDAVEKIVNAWDGEGMQVLYGMMRTLRDNKEHSVSMLSHQFLHEHMIWHPASFVTKDVYDSIGVFDTQYKSVADYDFVLRAYDSGKVRFTPVYAVIANFSEGGMSESAEGYLEGLKYRRDRGMISGTTYRLASIYEPVRRWAQRRLWK